MIRVNIQNIEDWVRGLVDEDDDEGFDALSAAMRPVPPWQEAEFRFNENPSGVPVKLQMYAEQVDRDGHAAWFDMIFKVWSHGRYVGILSTSTGFENHTEEMKDHTPQVRSSIERWFIDTLLATGFGPEMRQAFELEGVKGLYRCVEEVIYAYCVFPALVAMTFCHMKNTELEPVHESRKAKKIRERKGEPATHVIVIGGQAKRKLEGAGRSRGKATQAVRSLVRGHFKTYSEEAPLLGKHVGTYWWSPQVRGDEDREYTVKAS